MTPGLALESPGLSNEIPVHRSDTILASAEASYLMEYLPGVREITYIAYVLLG